jgi:hypothetical protein
VLLEPAQAIGEAVLEVAAFEPDAVPVVRAVAEVTWHGLRDNA